MKTYASKLWDAFSEAAYQRKQASRLRRASFMREVSAAPEAKKLLIGYRSVFAFVLLGQMYFAGFVAFLGFIAYYVGLIDLWNRVFSHGVWNTLVSLTCISCLAAPYGERIFVRTVMRRLAMLENRTYPRTAEKLLDLFLPLETAEEAIDHINAQFERRCTRYGLAHARRWYWWQVLRSVTEGVKYLVETALKVSGK